jgi:hypothetical protein
MSHSQVNHRRFFMHAAHEAVGVSAAAVARAWDEDLVEAADGDCPLLHVYVARGESGDLVDQPLAELSEQLQSLGRLRGRDVVFTEGVLQHADAESCDCLVLLGGPAPLDHSGWRGLQCYCRSGRPLVALIAATLASPLWPDFDREVLGGRCQGQWHNAAGEVAICEGALDHPALAGVGPLVAHGSLSRWGDLSPDTKMLLAAEADGRKEPIAWTHRHHGARVFCALLGRPADFQQAAFLRLLASAALWACDGGNGT